MDSPGQDSSTTAMLDAFGKQISWCDSLGAPFTARVLTLLAEDMARGGPVAGLVGAWPGDPVADAVPLRFAGALHAPVLNGSDPDLAACYPPKGGDGPGRLSAAVSGALARHDGYLRRFVTSPPQTNKVGRSAVLLGGFLQVAAATKLPLHLLKIGASAGLNLVWDRYGYRLGTASWGDPASPVRLAPDWDGPQPPMTAPLQVAGRAGCDVAPFDRPARADAMRVSIDQQSQQHLRRERHLPARPSL